MLKFDKLDQKSSVFDSHIASINATAFKIEPYKDKFAQDFYNLSEISSNFKKKIDDFNRDDRKLRIGIMGQVKAGKSSLLNALFFEGKEVLPKAATPKTANLTIINYSESNSLEIEYYNREEWDGILKASRSDEDTEIVKVAKELVSLVSKNQIDVNAVLGSSNKIINADSYKDLVGILNDYAGENGKFTPVVKSLRLNINVEQLKGFQIIDTPGMNDPVISRTQKTKEVMELTDVVFFLSQASNFLDKTDLELLIRQLPSKNVAKLIIIGSKYDSAILDDGWNQESYEECVDNIVTRLRIHAKKTVEQHVKELALYNHESEKSVVNALEGALPPIFVSSMAYNLAIKDEYSNEEKSILSELNDLWNDFEFDKDTLMNVSNFKELRKKFIEVIDNKEQTLMRKVEGFIPSSKIELCNCLADMRTKAEKHLEKLKTQTQKEIIEEKNIYKSKINDISQSIESVIGNLLFEGERKKSETVSELRLAIKDFSTLTEKTGSKAHESVRTVSDSKWYNPFSWGKSHKEYSTYYTYYKYLDVSEAIGNIQDYANEAVTGIEKVFNTIVMPDKVKKELKKVILESFDTSSENFDPGYFKLIIEKSINAIKLPIIRIDIEDVIHSVASSFSGEVTGSNMDSLKLKTRDALNKVFDKILIIFVSEIEKFQKILEEIRENLSTQILKDLNEDLDRLMHEFDEKESEINTYSSIITLIKTEEEKWR